MCLEDFYHFIYFSNIISNLKNIYFLKLHVTITRSLSQLIENIKILVSSDCVKDGSGALYDFAGQGQNHKSRSEQPDPQRQRRNDKQAEGAKHTKHLDFQHNPLSVKVRDKKLGWLTKFNFALNL
jgi:hypothetical protein